MTFTDQELRGALKEAKINAREHRNEFLWAKIKGEEFRIDGARIVYRESLATVAALNFLIAARKKKGKAK